MIKIEENLSFYELLENLNKCTTYDQAYIMVRPYMLSCVTDKLFTKNTTVHYILVEDGIYVFYVGEKFKVESLMFDESFGLLDKANFWKKNFREDLSNYEQRIENWVKYTNNIKTAIIKGE